MASRNAALLVLAVAFAFRLLCCTVPRLNVDEGWVYYVDRGSVSSIFENLRKDRHPPLNYLWLHAWMEMGGHDEFRLRLPQMLLATLVVFAAFGLTRDLFDQPVATLCALFVGTSYLEWEYDTWLRPYVWLSLFSLLSAWALWRFLRDGHAWQAAAYATALIVMIYSHYASVLVIGLQVLFVLWRGRGRLVAVALAWAVAAASFLPWLLVLHSQLGKWAGASPSGSPALALQQAVLTFPQASGLENLPRLLGTSPGYLVGATTILFLLVVPGALSRMRVQPGYSLWLCMLGLLPCMLALVAFQSWEFLRPRYYVVLVPWIGMLTAAACWQENRGGRMLARALMAAVVAVNLAVLWRYLGDSYLRSADWKVAAEWVRQRQSQAQVIVFYDNYCALAFDYYYARDQVSYLPSGALEFDEAYRRDGGLPQYRLWDEEVPAIADARMARTDRAFIVLWHEMSPRVRQWLGERFGLVDSLEIKNAQEDGRAFVYLVQRKRAATATQ